MRVLRSRPKRGGWTPVGNEAGGQNFALSLKAKGLLLTLMSYPDGYDMTLDKIVKLHELAGGKGEGKYAVREAMKELEKAGLVIRHRVQSKDGTWRTVIGVGDDPAALLSLMKGQ